MQLAHVPQGFRGTAHPLAAGARLLPSMQVEGVLGAGATSIVYSVRHVHFAESVAVKVVRLPSGNAEDTHRCLLSEARLYATLTDPRVPRVYYVDQLEDGSPCIVMERIVGRTVRSFLAHGPVSVVTACSLVVELLEILAHVHGRGVVHRDVKPSNLVLSRRGEDRVRLHLLDFGIGKFSRPRSDEPTLPFDHAVAGTLSYMAPELVSGGQPSVASDLYAAGVLLYQALTGELPYVGETQLDLLSAVLAHEARSVRALKPEVSPALARVAERAIAGKPAARFRSARSMKRALVAALWES